MAKGFHLKNHKKPQKTKNHKKPQKSRKTQKSKKKKQKQKFFLVVFCETLSNCLQGCGKSELKSKNKNLADLIK
jgi:hypothetical protein